MDEDDGLRFVRRTEDDSIVMEAGVRVWLPIRANNIKQKCDILGTNLCTFHLDPSIVQSFAPFSARISVLVFLRLE